MAKTSVAVQDILKEASERMQGEVGASLRQAVRETMLEEGRFPYSLRFRLSEQDGESFELYFKDKMDSWVLEWADEQTEPVVIPLDDTELETLHIALGQVLAQRRLKADLEKLKQESE